MQTGKVNFSVGGEIFPITMECINAHPNSFFARIIKPAWSDHESGTAICINRDAELFQYIYSFLTTDGIVALIKDNNLSLPALIALKREADYYNLEKLADICDRMVPIKLIRWCMIELTSLCPLQDVSEGKSDHLRDLVWSQLYHVCLQGKLIIENEQHIKILRNSTLANVDLTDAYHHSGFSYNPATRGSVELAQDPGIKQILLSIPAILRTNSTLCQPFLQVLSKGQFTLPYVEKKHAPTSIGMAYYVLHPAERGGELVVEYNGVRRSIREKNEYIVALYGCTH